MAIVFPRWNRKDPLLIILRSWLVNGVVEEANCEGTGGEAGSTGGSADDSYRMGGLRTGARPSLQFDLRTWRNEEEEIVAWREASFVNTSKRLLLFLLFDALIGAKEIAAKGIKIICVGFGLFL